MLLGIVAGIKAEVPGVDSKEEELGEGSMEGVRTLMRM